MTIGDRVRTRVSLNGIPIGTICTVRSVWEPGRGISCDVECNVDGWRSLHTCWGSELEQLEKPLPLVEEPLACAE